MTDVIPVKKVPGGLAEFGATDKVPAENLPATEWVAETVSQAEAEAGTATTRRAWTAQRVRQAIAAWWAASAMKTKLDGIATGATANDTDANLKSRSNHTGTQAIGTIVGLEAALASKAAAAGVPVKTVAGTTYTLLLEDAGYLVEFTSASSVTVTVPAQASVSFAGGEEYHLCQAGLGKVTVATTGGVTLVKPASQNAATRERESVCTLKRRATDSWRLFGDLEASA